MSVSFRKLATLDFEASGLNGWPIEIGWMREDDAEPTSFLIRPRPEFDRTRWSPNAEKLHGISLARIEREGVPASEIVPEFIAALDGHILVSDNPSFERRWLDMLVVAAIDDGAAPLAPMPHIIGLRPAVEMRAAAQKISLHAAIARFNATLQSLGPAPHRAGPDSARLLKALLSIRAWPVSGHAPQT